MTAVGIAGYSPSHTLLFRIDWAAFMLRRFATAVSILMLVIVVASSGGCNVWQKTEIGDVQIPLLEPASDQIALEISFVNVTADNEQLEYAVWRDADEQILANDLRRRLSLNGLRCGIVSEDASDLLQQLVADTRDSNEADIANGTGSLDKLGSRSQQMQLRRGRLGKVVATPTIRDSMVILTRHGERLVGETVDKAQCVFGVRCYPEADGQVSLELTPEIEYGEAKTRFVGKHEQSSWLMNSSRQRRLFPELVVRPTLAVGQTLVMSCMPEPVGLGKQFFSEVGEASGPSRTLLLLRLNGNGSGSLFSPDANATVTRAAVE